MNTTISDIAVAIGKTFVNKSEQIVLIIAELNKLAPAAVQTDDKLFITDFGYVVNQHGVADIGPHFDLMFEAMPQTVTYVCRGDRGVVDTRPTSVNDFTLTVKARSDDFRGAYFEPGDLMRDIARNYTVREVSCTVDHNSVMGQRAAKMSMRSITVE